MSSQRRSSPVMTNHQDANGVINDAKEKVVRESLEIHAPEIVNSSTENLWRFGCFLQKYLKLSIELASKLGSSDLLIVVHDPGYVVRDLPVEFEPPQLCRP